MVGAIAESLRVKERGTALTGILQGFEKGEKCVQMLVQLLTHVEG